VERSETLRRLQSIVLTVQPMHKSDELTLPADAAELFEEHLESGKQVQR